MALTFGSCATGILAEKGVLGTGSCFTFRIGNLEKGGLLPLDSTEFKIQYVSGITDEGSHDESLYQ